MTIFMIQIIHIQTIFEKTFAGICIDAEVAIQFNICYIKHFYRIRWTLMRMLSVLFSDKDYLHVYYIFQMRNRDMKSIGGLKCLYFAQETKKIKKNIYIERSRVCFYAKRNHSKAKKNDSRNWQRWQNVIVVKFSTKYRTKKEKKNSHNFVYSSKQCEINSHAVIAEKNQAAIEQHL